MTDLSALIARVEEAHKPNCDNCADAGFVVVHFADGTPWKTACPYCLEGRMWKLRIPRSALQSKEPSHDA